MKIFISVLSLASLLFVVAIAEVRAEDRVRGETCKQQVPAEIKYRPSLFECNGNAAVLLAGRYRNAYSVVLRRNGQFNDRDPNNTSCGSNRCSPYKVQKRIEIAEHQINCLGDTGYSAKMQLANRISIKYSALVTNANDESQFDQFCLPSTAQSFH